MTKVLVTLAILIISNFTLLAQEKKDKQITVKVKDNKQPMVFVDGKRFNFSVDLIDQSKINAMQVLKDKASLVKYNAPNGVILIDTKLNNTSTFVLKKDASTYKSNTADPLILVDGKKVNKDVLNTLQPEQIEKMEVIKGENALKQYKSKTGVILITTKKE